MKIKKLKKLVENYEFWANAWYRYTEILPCSTAEGKSKFPQLNWKREGEIMDKAVAAGVKLQGLFGRLLKMPTWELKKLIM